MDAITDLDLALRLLPSDLADFGPAQFAARLEQMEGRVIRFAPLAMPPGYFGLRLIVSEEEQPAEEYVFYASHLPAAHQEHIKTHELAHVALGHPTLIMTPNEVDEIRQDPVRMTSLLIEISCRANDPHQFDRARLARDQDAERLTRMIYQRRLIARQLKNWCSNSSQADLDGLLRRMGIA